VLPLPHRARVLLQEQAMLSEEPWRERSAAEHSRPELVCSAAEWMRREPQAVAVRSAAEHSRPELACWAAVWMRRKSQAVAEWSAVVLLHRSWRARQQQRA
jgi:hypothetical protein